MRTHALFALLIAVACNKPEGTVQPDEVSPPMAEYEEVSEPLESDIELEADDGVQIDTTTRIDGDLTEQQIQAVVDENHQRVSECFDHALADQDAVDLDGAVVVEWTVGPDGKVRGAAVAASNFGRGEAARCITATVKTWHFAKPKADTEVRYAFQSRSY